MKYRTHAGVSSLTGSHSSLFMTSLPRCIVNFICPVTIAHAAVKRRRKSQMQCFHHILPERQCPNTSLILASEIREYLPASPRGQTSTTSNDHFPRISALRSYNPFLELMTYLVPLTPFACLDSMISLTLLMILSRSPRPLSVTVTPI